MAKIIVALTLFLVLTTIFVDGFKKGDKGKHKKGPESSEPKKPEELKIEVQYRPENCDQKTTSGSKVSIHYTGRLVDGTVFDSSLGREPISFQLGVGQVIAGWDRGLLGMCVGEKRKLIIPPNYGYGDQGFEPVIPPKATLLFDTELISIE